MRTLLRLTVATFLILMFSLVLVGTTGLIWHGSILRAVVATERVGAGIKNRDPHTSCPNMKQAVVVWNSASVLSRGLACCPQPIIEAMDHWVVARCDQCIQVPCQEEGRSS